MQWRSTSVDLDNMSFLFPNYQEDVDDIYDKVEGMQDYIDYSLFENVLTPLTDVPDDQKDLDIDLNRTLRICRILEIREDDLDIFIDELQNLLYSIGQLTSDLMERRQYLEELRDSAEAHKVEAHKDFYSKDGDVRLADETAEALGKELAGTREPLLKGAADFLSFNVDKLSPGQLRKSLYELGFKTCSRCLRWRKFEDEDSTACKECKS